MRELDPAQVVSSILGAVCGKDRPRPTVDDLPARVGATSRLQNRMEPFLIRALHQAFCSVYQQSGQGSVVVLSKTCRDEAWDRSEFLHDITVLERKNISSAYLRHPLPVASRILWQVESELSGNGRELAIDFSKLIAGSAQNKLFIVRLPVQRQTNGQQRVCSFVQEMAEACSGNLFLAFLPPYAIGHPFLSYWGQDGALPFELFRLSSNAEFKPLMRWDDLES